MDIEEVLDPYYKDLDKLIPKSSKSETCTLENCNRNGIVVSALKDLPKQQRTRPTIIEVLNIYYISNEPEKKLPQNVALELGLNLKPLQILLNKCNDIIQRWTPKKKSS
ncbi:11502_t:CDS:2 [Gigaspora margarita]|uniref:11502_t:CDS:1 n=1 Tax=Gigaspora margarita TaxID=4874 RepID=A0ABN7V3B8_GIGMA|nr:11502_t:CDS:2 [Gigaspora margarita]